MSTTPSDARPGTAAEYPKRPSHFAHRVVRRLFKTCAVMEIGETAALLVIFVAHTEDVKRYTAAPNFYNDQLLAMLGIRKWETLDRARRAAVEAGWLHYQEPPSGTRKPGIYWAMIPERFADIDDTPVDETPYPTNGDGHPEAYPPNGYGRGDGRGYGRGDGMGDLPTLDPNPTPVPKEESAGADDPPAALLALIDGWNALPPGIVKPGNGARRDPIAKALLTRWEKAQKIPELREAFSDIPRILDAIRKAKACHGESWFDLEFLFSKKDDQYRVVRILNGKFDWTKASGNGKAPMRVGPSHRHPADAKTDRWGARPK